MFVRFFVLFVTGFFSLAACGDVIICGETPRNTIQSMSNESLTANLDGKAKVLSRLIGSAQLGGAIQTQKMELYQEYPDTEHTRAKRLLEWRVCMLLMKDGNFNTREKIEELKKVEREFASPLPPPININLMGWEVKKHQRLSPFSPRTTWNGLVYLKPDLKVSNTSNIKDIYFYYDNKIFGHLNQGELNRIIYSPEEGCRYNKENHYYEDFKCFHFQPADVLYPTCNKEGIHCVKEVTEKINQKLSQINGNKFRMAVVKTDDSVEEIGIRSPF